MFIRWHVVRVSGYLSSLRVSKVLLLSQMSPDTTGKSDKKIKTPLYKFHSLEALSCIFFYEFNAQSLIFERHGCTRIENVEKL